MEACSRNGSIRHQSRNSRIAVMNVTGEVILNARIQRAGRPIKERK